MEPPVTASRSATAGWTPTSTRSSLAVIPARTSGAHKLDRSGTIGAAIEAAHLGTPGIAVSLYDSEVGVRPFDRDEFAEAARVVDFLLETDLAGDRFRDVDYLNVNVPVEPRATPPIRLTQPAVDFGVSFERSNDGELSVTDHFYDPLLPTTDIEVAEEGTDRRACADGTVSVSPLSIDREVVHSDALGRTVDQYQHHAD